MAKQTYHDGVTVGFCSKYCFMRPGILNLENYLKIASNRDLYIKHDPYGDFDLILGAAKLKLKFMNLPVIYNKRVYGKTNISRWRDGWVLLKILFYATKDLKFGILSTK